MKKTLMITVVIGLFCFPFNSFGYQYIAITDDLYSVDAGSDVLNSSAIIRLEFYDHIRIASYPDANEWIYTPDKPLLNLLPGEPAPSGDYYYDVKEWSVQFTGTLSYLSPLSGDGGAFRWTLFNGDWLDGWAFLCSGDTRPAQMPPFWFYNLNWTDASRDDYLKPTSQWGAFGSLHTNDGDFGFTADFAPVPEPSTVVLLALGIMGLLAGRKLSKNNKISKSDIIAMPAHITVSGF